MAATTGHSINTGPYRENTELSYEKTMSCSGSHLGITINIKNTQFVKDLRMIDA
jgi:hypothetical protein